MTQNDIVQIAFDYGLFTGAFGFHYGAERIGASVIPISSGNTQRQIKLMQDFRTTALLCTPSYAMALSEAILESGNPCFIAIVEIRSFRSRAVVRVGACRASGQTEELLQPTTMASAKSMGPGVAGECFARNGLHINEDHFYVELVNPETLDPVGPEKPVNSSLRTLTREAFPLIRFRTRDLIRFMTEPCSCGRTLMRMSKVMGRTDDMINSVALRCSLTNRVRSLHCSRRRPSLSDRNRPKGALDEMTILVEVSDCSFSDEIKDLQDSWIGSDAISNRSSVSG